MTKPQKIYGWTTAIWAACVVVHLTWTVVHQRGLPSTEEVYVQALSFQIGVFVLTRLPLWLAALLMVLIFEFAAFGRKKKP